MKHEPTEAAPQVVEPIDDEGLRRLREEHTPVESRFTGNLVCKAGLGPWPCEIVRLLARIEADGRSNAALQGELRAFDNVVVQEAAHLKVAWQDVDVARSEWMIASAERDAALARVRELEASLERALGAMQWITGGVDRVLREDERAVCMPRFREEIDAVRAALSADAAPTGEATPQ